MSEFKRKELKEIFSSADIEVPKDVLTQIMELHSESIDSFRTTIDDLNEKIKSSQESGEKTVSKSDYDSLKAEYDEYKENITKKETHNAKSAAYRELLKAAGVSEKRIDRILKISDVDSVELDENGKIKDADKRTETIKADWGDFIVSTEEKGADTANPPANNPGKANPKSIAEALHQKYNK